MKNIKVRSTAVNTSLCQWKLACNFFSKFTWLYAHALRFFIADVTELYSRFLSRHVQYWYSNHTLGSVCWSLFAAAYMSYFFTCTDLVACDRSAVSWSTRTDSWWTKVYWTKPRRRRDSFQVFPTTPVLDWRRQVYWSCIAGIANQSIHQSVNWTSSRLIEMSFILREFCFRLQTLKTTDEPTDTASV